MFNAVPWLFPGQGGCSSSWPDAQKDAPVTNIDPGATAPSWFFHQGLLSRSSPGSSPVSTLLRLILPEAFGPWQYSCQLPGALRAPLHQGGSSLQSIQAIQELEKSVTLTKHWPKMFFFKLPSELNSRWPLIIHIFSNYFWLLDLRGIKLYLLHILFGINILFWYFHEKWLLIVRTDLFVKVLQLNWLLHLATIPPSVTQHCSFPESLFIFAWPSPAPSSRQRAEFNIMKSIQHTYTFTTRDQRYWLWLIFTNVTVYWLTFNQTGYKKKNKPSS